jgi:hypothetical protein
MLSDACGHGMSKDQSTVWMQIEAANFRIVRLRKKASHLIPANPNNP